MLKEFTKQAVEIHQRAVRQSGRQREEALQQALRVYDAILGRVVTEPFVLHALGTLFVDMKLFGVAAHLLMRCVETAPDDAPWLSETYLNLGVAMRNEAHEEEAAACYRRSLEKNPENAGAYANLSGVYVNYNAPDKVIFYADKALALEPENVQARHHRALALLELGKYEAGFKQYEARLELPEFHRRHYNGQMWDGEKLDGTLVVHGEQGLGDEVMFCSLLDRVKKRCARVIVECNERLVPLFERSFGVKCYGSPEEIKAQEKTDAWIAMGSLPRVFGIHSHLEHSGYLRTNPFKKYVKTADKPRIGVSWRGGMKKTHEKWRNFSVEKWRDLLTDDFEWVSIQYGDVKKELNEIGLVDTGWSGDMDEFASLVESCDHVITVCNTTVHFAGALNKPCWVLVPSRPAWRYGLTGERMLWYPSVKMYRQAEEQDWSEVITRVKGDLPGIQRT